jgi:hypothetical protein
VLASLLENHATETSTGWWEEDIPVVVIGQGTSQRNFTAEDLNNEE